MHIYCKYIHFSLSISIQGDRLWEFTCLRDLRDETCNGARQSALCKLLLLTQLTVF